MVTVADGEMSAIVVDGQGQVRLELSGYRTINLPGSLDAEQVDPLRAAVTDAPEAS